MQPVSSSFLLLVLDDRCFDMIRSRASSPRRAALIVTETHATTFLGFGHIQTTHGLKSLSFFPVYLGSFFAFRNPCE